jgi:hypothetical protein
MLSSDFNELPDLFNEKFWSSELEQVVNDALQETLEFGNSDDALQDFDEDAFKKSAFDDLDLKCLLDRKRVISPIEKPSKKKRTNRSDIRVITDLAEFTCDYKQEMAKVNLIHPEDNDVIEAEMVDLRKELSERGLTKMYLSQKIHPPQRIIYKLVDKKLSGNLTRKASALFLRQLFDANLKNHKLMANLLKN